MTAMKAPNASRDRSKSLPLKILHVDDEPDIRLVVRIALTMSGQAQLVQCISGSEALQRLETFRPDVILLDVMMPVMDGEQTLRAIHDLQGFTQVPVVFMTAKADRECFAKLIALGATGIISKPFDPLCLLDRIEQILDTALDKPA